MDASHIHEAGAGMGCSTLCHLNRAPPSLTTTSNVQDSNIPSIPCHAIFVFLDPILFGVMQVQYQNKTESPFETHLVQMQTFLTAICIYSALLGIRTHTRTQSGAISSLVLSYALVLSGALSSASLLSILLQPQVLFVVLFVWVCIPIILARHLLKSSARWIIEMMAKLTNWDVRNFKLATMVLIFHNKDSAPGNNTTCPTERVQSI